MLLFIILALVLLILIVFTVIAIGVGGAAFIIVFGDVIVCIWLIVCIIRRLTKGKKK